MKTMLSIFAFFLGFVSLTHAQVVWSEPSFLTQLDDVTIYFDASEGNGALAGVNETVYAHTGLITSESSNGTDWKHVQGNWGTADPNTIMISEGNDIYSIAFNIEDYYGVNPGEEVLQLAFVFRNADGSIVGRETDGTDIFLEVYPPNEGLFLALQSPSISGNNIIYLGDSVKLDFEVNKKAWLEIYDNGTKIFEDSTTNETFYIHPTVLGNHELSFKASKDADFTEVNAQYFVLENNPNSQAYPNGTKMGLNYFTDDTFVFRLFAPNKEHVFLLCPENDFKVDTEFLFNRTPDTQTHWIELPKSYFIDGKNSYQYLVDGQIKIADPYSEVVLDPWNDNDVPVDVLSELPDYPNGMTTGLVTAFDVEKPNYDWQVDNFDPIEKTDLVIYEILIRDFLEDHNYKSLIDSLDYFQKLGVNAIELMPIQEFEGNDSWGYNPSFHMAVDKYYGSRNQLKQFIDEAHQRGIAVILDVVFNHAFSQSPLCQLYWDAVNFRPTEDSPFLNVEATHPYNVGYDFNHASQATKSWVKRVLEHWIVEYKFDGFRFDLSKGMTQTVSGSNGDLMSQYDASRISILKNYADFIWNFNPDIYVILEHFAYNSEETELANYGMMLWGNINHEFNEASMGYNSNLNWTGYQERGWSNPNLIAYMESHDEERLMYKNLEYGNSTGSYNVKNITTALDRIKAVSALHFTIPGPKMLWQFGELGYDYSINRCVNGSIDPNCRLDPKPIRWDYLDNYNREVLRQHHENTINLKTTYPTFATTDYTLNDNNSYTKTLHLNHSEMDAVTLVNYDVKQNEINPDFQNTGMWFEYYSGDTLIVDNVEDPLFFAPGEFRIYTSEKITPPGGFLSSTNNLPENISNSIFPNPIRANEFLSINHPEISDNHAYRIFDFKGQIVQSGTLLGGSVELQSSLLSGIYILEFSSQSQYFYGKFSLIN